jgi:hypothetical protein
MVELTIASRSVCLGAPIRCVVTSSVSAREPRSTAVTREFERENPCPSIGRTSGACPGYVKDHIKSLECGGADAVSNLQWQTIAQAKAKDKWERRGCGIPSAAPHFVAVKMIAARNSLRFHPLL